MSTHSHVGTEWLGDRNCPVCGKNFSALYPDLWRYKYNTGKKVLFYCSYGCKREAEKERDEMKKLTLGQKKKAVQIAVDGGNPLGFLEDLGIKNSAEAWSKIKAHLKEFDPDTYAQLPKRLPQRVQKAEAPKVVLVEDKPEGTLADAVQGMTEAANQFFGACEAMGLNMEPPEKPKITRPMNYMGLDITAVKPPDLGEFYYDHKYGTIDWRFEGEEISIKPDDWKRLLEWLPTILKVLGVDPE